MNAGFAWKRGLKHIGAVLGVLLVAGAVVAATWAKDPEKFGEGMGRFMVFAGLVTYGVSYLWQTGRRRWAMAAAGGFVALVAGLTVAVVLNLPKELTATEKAPLRQTTRDGRDMLEHPALGFRIAHPGAGFEDIDAEARRAVEQAFPGRNDVTGWAWRNEASGDGLIVLLVKDDIGGREGFAGLVRGLSESMAEVTGGSARIAEEAIVWTDAERSAVFAAGVPAGGHLVARFLAADGFVVGALAMVGDAAAARELAMTLSLGP